MGDFDRAARMTAKLDPPRFAEWLRPGLGPRLTFHRWLDTRTLPFPGDPDRICDTVAEFRDAENPDHPWVFITEFQSEPDLHILDRFLEYVARLRRELRHGPARQNKYLVAGALVNLSGRAQPDTLDMQLPGLPGLGLRMQIVLRTLPDEDAEVTLAAIAAGSVGRCILPLIPLMHGAAEPTIIERWKQVAGEEPSGLLRSIYAGLALVFADLARRLPPWTRALEGWNVQKSQVVEGWREEGRVEGRAEGWANAQIAIIREDLLRLVRGRWRAEVPADLTKTLENIADLDQLSRLFDAAIAASSLEEFRTAVRN